MARFTRIGFLTAVLVWVGAPAVSGEEYSVREGDTLEKVHVELGHTIDDLRAMNPWLRGIGDKEGLEAGKKVVFMSEGDLRAAAESLRRDGISFERSAQYLRVCDRKGYAPTSLPWNEVLRRVAEEQKRITVLPVRKSRPEFFELMVVPTKSVIEWPKQ